MKNSIGHGARGAPSRRPRWRCRLQRGGGPGKMPARTPCAARSWQFVQRDHTGSKPSQHSDRSVSGEATSFRVRQRPAAGLAVSILHPAGRRLRKKKGRAGPVRGDARRGASFGGSYSG